MASSYARARHRRSMKNPFRLNLGDRQFAFESGEALDSHAKAVHNGKPEPECPACQELQRRILEDTKDQIEEHEQ